MLKPLTLSLSAILSSTVAMPAAAQDETVVFKPAGSWILDYGENRCRLGRVFGTGEDETIFWIEQTGPSASFSWLAAGGLVKRLGSYRNMHVAFGSFPEYEVNTVRGTFKVARFGKALSGNGFQKLEKLPDEKAASPQERSELALDTAVGAQIGYIDFSRKGLRIRLDTGSLKDAFAALNACTADLYAHWGIDVATLKAVVEGAKPKNMERVARLIQDSYPREAEARREEAIIRMTVVVGVDGKVEKCSLINETFSADFNELPCIVMSKYAEFEPALDAQGKPVRSTYNTSLSYRIF